MADKDNISDENDFALFREQMRDAEPIHHNTMSPDKPRPQPKAHRPQNQHKTFQHEIFSDMAADDNIDNEDYLEYRGPGIQHGLFNKLRHGKVHIEAELDLHGLKLAMAEPAISQFLVNCQQQDIRCVRIIHGKGWRSKDNKPVLKNKLNHWLRQSSIVLAFCSATIKDGGTGAMYVLLKRQPRSG